MANSEMVKQMSMDQTCPRLQDEQVANDGNSETMDEAKIDGTPKEEEMKPVR